MSVHSLFDPKRKKEIRQGIANGRLDLRRRRIAERDVSDEAPTETFTRSDTTPVEDGPDDLLPPSMQPVPATSVDKRAISKMVKQPNPFAHMNPKVEGPMGSPSAQSGGGARDIDPAKEFQQNVDNALFNAIRAGDFSAAKDAIGRGANVNALEPSQMFGDGFGDSDAPEATVMFSIEKPLVLARRLGHKDIEDLLRRHGAKM